MAFLARLFIESPCLRANYPNLQVLSAHYRSVVAQAHTLIANQEAGQPVAHTEIEHVYDLLSANHKQAMLELKNLQKRHYGYQVMRDRMRGYVFLLLL